MTKLLTKLSYRKKNPPAVILLYILLAQTFLIYMPVMIFRNVSFLIAQDFLVLSIIITITLSVKKKRILSGDGFLIILITLYISGVLSSLFMESNASYFSIFQANRSLLFGIIILILSSMLIDTFSKVDIIIKIIIIGSIIISAYGFKQIIFGLTDFEFERISQFGNVAGEIIHLNRTRIPSTFGDPATFAFFMMIGSLIFIGYNQHLLKPKKIIILCLLISSLVMSLTRAPLLGFILAVLLAKLYVENNRTIFLLKIGYLILLSLIIIIILDVIVNAKMLIESDDPIVNIIYNVLLSVWSIIPSFLTSSSDTGFAKIAGLSFELRYYSWFASINFILEHPFGGGAATITDNASLVLGFSPADVGFLRYGIEAGWLTMFSLFGILLRVFVLGHKKIKKISNQVDKKIYMINVFFLFSWLAGIIASSITNFLYTEVSAIIFFIIGGMILNIDKVYKNLALMSIKNERN